MSEARAPVCELAVVGVCAEWRESAPQSRQSRELYDRVGSKRPVSACVKLVAAAVSILLQKLNYTPAVRSNIVSKLIFASCV